MNKRNIFLILSILCLLIFYFVEPFSGLSKEGMWVLGIFFTSLLLWIGVAIDWPSLITILLIGFLPTLGFSKAFSGAFGNSTVAFLMFTFMLVYPLSQTNFVRRVTIAFITNRIAIKGPWYFICFLFAAVTLLGLFISPSVLFVAFLPFLEDIYAVLGLKKGSKAANMLMLGTAFCISMSSGMTPIGHVWPTLAMGAYASFTGEGINQFQYMAIGIPVGIVIEIFMILMFKYLYRANDIKDIDASSALSLKGSVPKADLKEKIILLTVALVVFLWISPSLVKDIYPGFYKYINGLTTAMPPLLGCIILFVCQVDGKPIMTFKDASTKGILWGSVLMTGAATLIGSCLTNETIGISLWLSNIMTPLVANVDISLIVLFFVAWTVIETNFSSNIVTTTIVSSIALAVLSSLNATINLATVICLIGFGAGICNMTPAGQSTINTVAIGSGYTDTKSMFIWGGFFALIAIVIMSTLGYYIGLFIF